jgi:hypothetical protein
VDITYSGAASGNVCLGAVPVATWACPPWNTNTPATPDGNYTLTMTVTDFAGNVFVATKDVVIDNQPPVAAFQSFTEIVNGQYMHAPALPAPGSTMYYNPAYSGELAVNVTATDAGTGMQDVTFPDLASAGWNPPGGVDGTAPWSQVYNWTAGAAQPGTVNAIARDMAGNATNVSFRIEADTVPPSGGSFTPLNVTTNAADHGIAYTIGSDSQSGVGTVRIQREGVPFSGGTCDPFTGTWTTIVTDPAASPYQDPSTAHGNCYRYRMLVDDRVANQQELNSPNTFRVDRVAPFGDINPAIVGPLNGVQVIDGTSGDATSGVQTIELRYTGPANGDLTPSCVGTTAWSCTWDTSSLGDGTYELELTVRDNAGNTFVVTRPNLVVDNQPPLTAFVGFIEGTNGPYMHAIGSTMYYNNNVGFFGDFQVEISATDAGTGVANVGFPAYGAGWTPAAPTLVNAVPYRQSYGWTAGSANPSLQTATATDNAGNAATATWTVTPDITPPAGASISYADGITNASTMVVSFNPGTDTQSTVQNWTIQRSVEPYVGGVCDPAPPVWVTVVSSPPGASWTDPTVPNGSCVEYRLLVNDYVSNQAIATTSSVVEVDRTPPTGLIDAAPPSPMSGTVTLTGISSDGQSGISHVELHVVGAPAPNDVICLSPPSPTAWSCDWNTNTVADGAWDLRLTVYDRAGNTFTYVRSVIVDNQPPATGVPEWIPQTNPQFQYVNPSATEELWFNSNQTGTARLLLRTCDTSGIAQVDFPNLGAGWTGGGVFDDTADNPAACAPDLGGDFTNVYTWTPAAVSSGLQDLTAWQQPGPPAGAQTQVGFQAFADGTPPTLGSISYVSATTNLNSAGPMILTVGSDGLGSGIRGWRIERERSDLLANGCINPGSWTTVGSGLGAAAPPYTDTSMTGGSCYRYRLVSIDNVGNEATWTDPDVIRYDTTAPTGTIDAAPAGPVSGATVVITGTADDIHTAVDRVEMSWTGPQAPGSGAMCADPVPAAPTWSCTWDTSGFVDGTYTMILTIRDLAGNIGNASRTIVVDNQPPIALFDSWTPTINTQYQRANGTRLYFNPNQTGTAQLRIAASDAGTGINRVEFPDLDGALSLWNPGAGNGSPPNPYMYEYSWSAGAPSSGVMFATAFDNASNPSTVEFDVVADGVGPVGQTVNPINAYVTTTSTSVGFTTGSDALSGVQTWQMQRQQAPLTGGICGAYGGWSNVGLPGTGAPFNDTGLANGMCYQYQLLVTDWVGNTTPASSGNEVKVDTTRPTGTILPPGGPWAGAQQVDATTADTGSGVGSATLSFSGPASGTICTVVNPGASFSCPWDSTLPPLPDGTYTVTLLVTDRAGNQNDPPIQQTFVIDNNGPLFAFDSFTEGANPQFQHIAGNIMYVNPLGNGSFTVAFTGSDAGSGMNRVDFPDIGANWSPVGGGSDTTGPEPWTFDYAFSSGNAEPSNPTDPIATAWDMAGNTSTASFRVLHDPDPPIGGSIDVPTTGPTNAMSVDIAWTHGADALSGVGDVAIMRRSRTYSGGICSGAWGGWTQVATGTGASGTYTDSALADGTCYDYGLVLFDNVRNQSPTPVLDALGDIVRIDRTPPTGAITGPPGPWAGVVTITGTATDANSGVVDMDLTTIAPTANDICLNMPLGSPWSCVLDTTTLPEGTYTFNLAVTDAAGNVNSVAITYTVLIDNGGPLVTGIQWVPQVNPQFQHVDPLDASKLYFNPVQTGTSRLQLVATDAGSGVQDVVFPALGTGWTASPGLTSTGPNPYFVDYTFSSATPPGAVTATARDNANNPSPAPFSAVADAAAPSGGSIDYTDGYTNVTTPTISFTPGTDAAGPPGTNSGIRSWQLVRESAPLVAGACVGPYGGQVVVSSNPGGTTFSDSGLVDGTCYRYRMLVTDFVGNVATYDAGAKAVMIDTTVPFGTIDGTPVSPVSAIQDFTGTSGDASSGVQSITVTFTGPSPVPPCTVTLPATVNPWTCNLNTASYGDGTYTLSLVVTDRAGNNSTPVTRDVVFDNNPPVISPFTWIELTGTQFTHPAGDDLWFNPAGSATMTLSVPVIDPGSGVANVTFPAPGAGWTPGAPIVNATPPSPYTQLYTLNVGASDPPTQTLTATDVAGNASTRSFELRQDVTPPTGTSISYLGGPSSATGTSITIDTTGSADAGSGLGRYQLQRDTGTLAGGVCTMNNAWVNIGLPNEASPFTDSTTVDGSCYEYRLLHYDNVENALVVQPGIQVQVDRTAPIATIVDPVPAQFVSGTYDVTGTHSDAGSGVDYFSVTHVGTAAGDVCVNDTQASPWTCPWTTTLLAEGAYDLTVIAFDNAGNMSAPFTVSVVVDNSPPAIAFDSWVDGTNPQFTHPAGSRMWFNPAGNGSFGLRMLASDGGSGVQRVDFPALGAGWNPPATQSDNTPPGPIWVTPINYSFSAGASDPGPAVEQATAFDFVGNSASGSYSIDADSTAPTGVSISYPVSGSGYQASTSIGVTFEVGADTGGSGIGRWQIQRRESPLVAGACPAWGGWGNVGGLSPNGPVPPVGPSTWIDSSLVTGNCYRYQVVVWDNVENATTIADAAEVRVDAVKPVGTINALPPFVTGLVPLSGTHFDAHSGVDRFTVAFGDTDTGFVCENVYAPSPWSSPTCDWDTVGMSLADGPYELTITVVDVAGNISDPFTVTTIVDNGPPTLAFNSYLEGAGSQYQHAVGSTMYYNRTQTGSFTLRMDANDAGSGVNRVEFPALGASWSPAAMTPDTSGPNPYEMTYSWSPGAAPVVGAVATAFDNVTPANSANATFDVVADDDPSTGSTISVAVPPSGYTNQDQVDVTFQLGTDALSGIGSWQLQRQAGTLAADVCTMSGTWTNVGGASPGGPIPPAGPVTVSDTPLSDATCYQYRIRVRDNVFNLESVEATETLKVDKTAPFGAFTAPVGPFVTGVIDLQGTHGDTHGLVDYFTVSYTGPSSGNVPGCVTSLQPSPWTCTFDTNTVADGSYTFELVVTDVAGNTSAPFPYVLVVDNTNPELDFLGWIENGGANFTHPVASTMFYNPTGTGTFTLQMTARDDGSGIQHVTFPQLGANWNPPGPTADSTGIGPVPSIYDVMYGFNPTSAVPADPQQAVAQDFVGRVASRAFRVVPDGDVPVGGSVNYSSVTSNAASFDIGFTMPNDGSGSGVRTWQLQRESAPFDNGDNSCDAFSGVWVNVGLADPAVGLPVADAGTLDGYCYRYRLAATDHVGNTAFFTSPNEVRVDRTAPTGTFSTFTMPAPTGTIPAVAGAFLGGIVTVDGTASDAASGLTVVGLYANDGVNPPFLIGDPTTTGPHPWQQDWDTSGSGDGTFTLEARIRDLAGNEGTVTISVVVDNTAPAASLFDIIEGTNPQFQHANVPGATLWYNPAQFGDFRVVVQATDSPGSGMDQVDFPDLGAGWTPIGGFSDLVVNAAPPDTWGDQNYTWTAASAAPTNPVAARAYDNAGNATDVPFSVRPDGNAPTPGIATVVFPGFPYVNAAGVPVGFSPGADTVGGATDNSGFDRAQLMRQVALFSSPDTCGAFGLPAPIGAPITTPVAGSFIDTDATTPRCFQYVVRTFDRVGNFTDSPPSAVVKYDNVAPTGGIDVTPGRS